LGRGREKNGRKSGSVGISNKVTADLKLVLECTFDDSMTAYNLYGQLLKDLIHVFIIYYPDK
jgi:hypothetical protein